MPFSDTIRVRRAVEADVRALSDLAELTFRDTYAAFNTPADMDDYVTHHFTVDILKAEMADPSLRFFVAELSGEMAGYCMLDTKREIKEVPAGKKVEISRIYVTKKFFGKKVGAALMHSCMQEAEKMQALYLWLGVWQKNKNAIAFYQHYDFEIMGSINFILGGDVQRDFIMAKRLS